MKCTRVLLCIYRHPIVALTSFTSNARRGHTGVTERADELLAPYFFEMGDVHIIVVVLQPT